MLKMCRQMLASLHHVSAHHRCRHQGVIHDDVPKRVAGLLTTGERILYV